MWRDSSAHLISISHESIRDDKDTIRSFQNTALKYHVGFMYVFRLTKDYGTSLRSANWMMQFLTTKEIWEALLAGWYLDSYISNVPNVHFSCLLQYCFYANPVSTNLTRVFKKQFCEDDFGCLVVNMSFNNTVTWRQASQSDKLWASYQFSLKLYVMALKKGRHFHTLYWKKEKYA